MIQKPPFPMEKRQELIELVSQGKVAEVRRMLETYEIKDVREIKSTMEKIKVGN